MKFKIGDKVKLYRPLLRASRSNVGAVGEIVGFKTYGRRWAGDIPTHYVVKFDCYKRSHEYMTCEIEDSCDLIKEGTRCTCYVRST